jgi:hypothetical protein
MARFLLAALLVGAVSADIYPDDHWSYSTKLSVDSFDSFIKTNVDSGKTAFVRWIASSG